MTDSTVDAGAELTLGTGIQISALSKTFKVGGGKTVTALQDTDEEITEGGISGGDDTGDDDAPEDADIES